jgi:hypothetical protein
MSKARISIIDKIPENATVEQMDLLDASLKEEGENLTAADMECNGLCESCPYESVCRL